MSIDYTKPVRQVGAPQVGGMKINAIALDTVGVQTVCAVKVYSEFGWILGWYDTEGCCCDFGMPRLENYEATA